MIADMWLVLVGLGAGMVGSVAGLGGGLIIVPVLTSAGFSAQAASANSLFATLGNAAASTIAYATQNRVHTESFVRLAGIAIPGTVLGALASDIVEIDEFKILFAVLLFAGIAYMILGKNMSSQGSGERMRVIVLSTSASFFAGVISSFFGIGGGIVFVPVLVIVMGLSMKDATATSQAILVPVSFAAMLSHIILGHPDYYHALLLMAGAVVGGFVGAQMSVRISNAYLKVSVLAIMAGAAIKLAYDSIYTDY